MNHNKKRVPATLFYRLTQRKNFSTSISPTASGIHLLSLHQSLFVLCVHVVFIMCIKVLLQGQERYYLEIDRGLKINTLFIEKKKRYSVYCWLATSDHKIDNCRLLSLRDCCNDCRAYFHWNHYKSPFFGMENKLFRYLQLMLCINYTWKEMCTML